MNEFIEKLKQKIHIELLSSKNELQRYYVAGLCDALELAKEINDSDLQVGKKYYVIMYKDGNEYQPYIQQMVLYKITNKSKKYYCFSDNLKPHINSYDATLVLSSKASVYNRVFETLEEANEKIK